MSTSSFLSNGNRHLMLRNSNPLPPPPPIKLSHVLSTIPNFSFFDELINLPQPLTSNPSESFNLLQRDVFQITKVLEDINLYLNDLLMIFNNVEQASKNVVDVLDWYFEGKSLLQDLLRNIENIDSIISQLLLVVESSNNHESIGNNLLGIFEEISDLVLDVKKSLIMFKKYLDISINYREIIDSVIKSLSNEIEDCIKCILKLKELKLASPKNVLPNFTLQSIISKMKINDLSSGTFSFKSMRLPTFSDLDEKLYNDYLELESKIDPLRTSLSIVPLRIDDFNTMCAGQFFVKSRENVLDAYEVLVLKWNMLLKEKNSYKKDNINVKWNEIFEYLIEEIFKECGRLIREVGSSSSNVTIPPATGGGGVGGGTTITDEVGNKYKMCSNSITLIQKAFKENIITDPELVTIFNHDLVPKWEELNNIITNNGNQSRTEKRILMYGGTGSVSGSTVESNGLRSFQTGSRSSSSGERPISNGIGIDFNLVVESTSVPLSVHKSDRTKDVISSAGTGTPLEGIPPRSKNLRHSLISVFEDSSMREDEDEATTLVKSPSSKVVKEENQTCGQNKDFNNLFEKSQKLIENNQHQSEQNRIDFAAYIEKVIHSPIKIESKLPKIPLEYIKQGCHITHKRPDFANTRIPRVILMESPYSSPQSNAKRLEKLNAANGVGSFVSPLRNKKNESYSFNRSRASSNATVIGRPNSLLHEMKVPNLTFSKRLTYNLESFHESGGVGGGIGGFSSFESRFDEENLLHSLKETSIWK